MMADACWHLLMPVPRSQFTTLSSDEQYEHSGLVVDDGQVASDELVLERGAVGDHDLVALGGDNDARSGQADALAEVDIARDSQVVQLGNVGDRLEPLLEVLPA